MKKLIYIIFLLILSLSINLSINMSWASWVDWIRGEGKLITTLKYCDLGTDCVFHPVKEEVLIGTKARKSDEQDRNGVLKNGDYTCRITQKDQVQPLISSIKVASGFLRNMQSSETNVHSEDFVPLTEKETNFDFYRTLDFSFEGSRELGFISILIVKSFSYPLLRADPNVEVTVNCHKK